MKLGKKTVRVLSVKNQSLIADQCIVAESFLSRLIGLLGKKTLKDGEGLWLRPCNDIHMWFMLFPIDVIFIRDVQTQPNGVTYAIVSSVFDNVQPWKLLPVRDWKSTQTLELPVGTIERSQVRPGDHLCLS